ncbi:hypothetical protein CFL01nite_05270 [Corynebacterium flavescens]|uniref:Uncharacterized protein n=1 Tax=Corynebacterium flavescens TaxID=28028 RepID=A0AB73B6A2_CORFL|nr:hypothetical protein CFL01nite_05270 [Corynebacterium flavescens]
MIGWPLIEAVGEEQNDIGFRFGEDPLCEEHKFNATESVKKKLSDGRCVVYAEKLCREHEAHPSPIF